MTIISVSDILTHMYQPISTGNFKRQWKCFYGHC